MCKVELRECFKIQNDTADCQQTVFYALTVDLKNLTVKFANLTVRFRCLANKLWNLTVTFLNLTVRYEHSPEKPSYLRVGHNCLLDTVILILLCSTDPCPSDGKRRYGHPKQSDVCVKSDFCPTLSYLPAMQSADRWRMLLLKAIYETLTKVSSCCD